MKIMFEHSTAHWNDEDMRPSHGPQHWPWWRLASFSLVRLGSVARPSIGRRLWVYTRWGAVYVGVYIDRRASA